MIFIVIKKRITVPKYLQFLPNVSLVFPAISIIQCLGIIFFSCAFKVQICMINDNHFYKIHHNH